MVKVTAPVDEFTSTPVPPTAEVTPVLVIVSVSVALAVVEIPVPPENEAVLPSEMVCGVPPSPANVQEV